MSQAAKTCVDCHQSFTLDLGTQRHAEQLARLVTRCPTCTKAHRAKQQAQDDEQARIEAENQWRRRLSGSGLPAPLHHTPHGGLGLHGDVARDVDRFIRGDLHGLLLTGPVGTGKTTIAAHAFRGRLMRRAGYWRSAPALLMGLMAKTGTQVHDEAQGALQGRRMLALDDLDKARVTEYAAEQMYLAIDNAYAHQIPIVVTSNLTLGELAKRWPSAGEAIASRLYDMCEGKPHVIAGRDRRMDKPTPIRRAA